MTDLDYKQFRSMVRNVANSVSRSFPSYVDARDTEGQLWVTLYERRDNIRKTLEDHPTEWEAMISSTMRKWATEYCYKEKAQTEGYDPRDSYAYSLVKIQSLLESVFEHEDWQSFGNHSDGQPIAKRQSNETGDRIAELSDVSSAIQRLPDPAYSALLYTYKYRLSNAELGVELDVSEEAAKKRVQRAREALQRELGRKDTSSQPGPGDRRTVRTNAATRAALANQYDG